MNHAVAEEREITNANVHNIAPRFQPPTITFIFLFKVQQIN
jgi:hypothetical protein